MPNQVRFNFDYPTIDRSNRLHQRASGLIPAHTQVLAKGPTQYVNGVAPKFLTRGAGSRVWDVDGNEYLDFNMAVGPISLGYAFPAVDEAIRRQLADGINFSLVHPLEVEVAELIRDLVPNAEAVRFAKSGAEVTSAAVRLARAYTGREKIIACGYHGWHDWYIGTTPRPGGVPEAVRELTGTFAYNDLASLEAVIDDRTAAVIMEPMIFDEPEAGFLEGVQALCRENGALLIFDEIWTGFRFHLGGAQTLFGVTPDLAAFSKAMANGLPIAALTGPWEIMRLLEEEVFFFSTFGGEVLSLAATQAALTFMRDYDVPAHLIRLGERLEEGYNALAEEFGLAGITGCKGFPARSLVWFAGENPLLLKSFVQQELIKRGILWSGFHNLSYSHTEGEIDYTLEAYAAVLEQLKRALEDGSLARQLRGVPVQPVFRKVGDGRRRPQPA